MKLYYDKVVSTFLKEGFLSTFKKISKNSVVRTKRFFNNDKENNKRIHLLRNKYKGKRVFLIGNGPSLNSTPLYLLKNEYTMCFNRINILFERISWRPTFYSCIDATVLDDISQEINDSIVPEVGYAFFTDFHLFELTNTKKRINQRHNTYWLYPDFTDFSFDLPKIAPSPTVALTALQILPFLGFSEIIIIGMDMNYTIHKTVDNLGKNAIQAKNDDDPNHFDPRYFGKGKRYHQPTEKVLDNIINKLKIAKDKLSVTGTKVFNATLGGKLEVFERIDFNSLFSYSAEEQFNLFAQTFKEYLLVENFEELKSKVQIVKNIDLDTFFEHFFLLEQDEYIIKVSKLIFNYIPFGPYNNYYLLVRRKNLSMG